MDNKPKKEQDDNGMPAAYNLANKLEPILDRSQFALIKIKDLFHDQLRQYQQVEKKVCSEHGLPPQMQGEKFRTICNMLERAKDFFWVEALAYFVFDQNTIPNEKELNKRYRLLKNLGDDITPTRTKSYLDLKI